PRPSHRLRGRRRIVLPSGTERPRQFTGSHISNHRWLLGVDGAHLIRRSLLQTAIRSAESRELIEDRCNYIWTSRYDRPPRSVRTPDDARRFRSDRKGPSFRFSPQAADEPVVDNHRLSYAPGRNPRGRGHTALALAEYRRAGHCEMDVSRGRSRRHERYT
ncbi:MAG: hypothetical protein QOH57_3079, partial [Mycobacterium sp.]|nr:hypothetical protein [Mycobacterium sp.]